MKIYEKCNTINQFYTKRANKGELERACEMSLSYKKIKNSTEKLNFHKNYCNCFL